MIAVGSCIGSGIFVTPYEVVRAVPNHLMVLLVWALGGFIALTGALTFAELGGMFPRAGGVYVFLREAYGELVAFLYGWIILLVINTGALAALGIAFAEYMRFFFPQIDQPTKNLLAIGAIVGLTALNLRGIQVSQAFANTFTALKLGAIAAIIVAGIWWAAPEHISLQFQPHTALPTNPIQAMLVALIGVLWSFGGWHHATYVAGEAIDPQRTVPRAMVLAALIVTLTYLLVNWAYMLLLPLEAIAASERVAGDAIATIVPWGGKLVAIAIAISIFGTIGIYTMTAPRIYYAMARDGLFFQRLARVHPRWHTPAWAMAAQALWAVIILLFWGGFFGKIITYVTFMDIAFMALAGTAVLVLRVRRPDAERPYRVWGYPFTPLIFVLISMAFVVNTLIARPIQAWAGLTLLGLGIGAYQLFCTKSHPRRC